MDLLHYKQLGQKLKQVIDEQERVAEQRTMLDEYKSSLDGEKSLENKEIYPHLMSLIGQELKAGDKVRFGDDLYWVQSDHTVSGDVYPGLEAKGEISELYAKVLPDDAPYQNPPAVEVKPETEKEEPEVIEIWVATGIYKLGQKVIEKDRVYESLKDENWDRPSESEGKSWQYLYDL
jgi:hypothetical protein